MNCDRCGQPIGAPHQLLPDDCILGHTDHTTREHGLACRRHFHWINDTLYQIGELFALIDDVIIPGPAGDQRHGTRAGSPAPGRVEVMALTDRRAKTPIDLDGEDDIPDLPGALESWARLEIEEQTEDGEARRAKLLAELDGTVACSIRVLRRDRAWIAQRDWLDDYVTELAALHRAVAFAVGDTMWPRSIGKCPSCGTPMYPEIGLDVATCRRCKASWAGPALARLRLIHEQDGVRA